MAFNNKFTFVGKIKLPKEDAKRPLHSVIYKKAEKDKAEKDRTWEGHKLNFFMEVDKNNGQFAEMMAGWMTKSKEIKSWSKGSDTEKGSELLVPVAKRNDKEIIDMVADFKKYKVNLGEEKVFITDYDFVIYLAEALKTVGDRLVYISGDFKIEESNGKFYKKFIPKVVQFANEDATPKFSANIDIFFNEESLSEARFEDQKLIDVMAYVQQNMGKEKGDRFLPLNLVIDAKKVDMENESHVKRLEYLKSQFSVGETFHHVPWTVTVFRGADQVEFSEDMLTDAQKEQIEFGLAKLSDFQRSFNGETVELYKLIKPNLLGAFSEGAVDTSLSLEDVMAKLCNVSVEIANKEDNLVPTSTEEDDDLFS